MCSSVGTGTAGDVPEGVFWCIMVYMSRTNIVIDDDLVERAMRIYRLHSKREAVDLALRRLVGNPMSREEMLAMRGRGWDGDLDGMRAPDTIPVLSFGDPAPRDSAA